MSKVEKLVYLYPGLDFDSATYGPKHTNGGGPCLGFEFEGSTVTSLNERTSFDSFEDAHVEKAVRQLLEKCTDAEGKPITRAVVVAEGDTESKPSPARVLLEYFANYFNLASWIPFVTLSARIYEDGHIWQERIEGFGSLLDPFDTVIQLPCSQDHIPMIYLPEDRLKIYTHSLQAIKKGSPERYRHLVNSLSLYNAAIHASRNGQAAAIVLLVAALEALLEIPRGARKAETFAHSASLLWGFSKRVQVWARQLYETRSTIVHGSVPKEEQLYASPEKHQSVLTLAKEFYEVSLLLRLEAQGFVTWEEEAKFAELESFVHKLESNKKKIEALEARKEALSFETVSPEGSEHYRELIGRIESLSYFDLTGSERIPAVLGIISDIAIPWIEKTIVDCRERLECLENDANARKHLSWYLEQLERVKGAFDKTLGVELSASPTFEERMQWKQAIHELQEEIRRLYPVVPDRTRFAYHLEEFLTRTITPVFLLRL